MTKSYVGKKVIVRTNRAGVFFGTLVEADKTSATLSDVRKLWFWDGACAVEEIAENGVGKPENCKFTVVIPEMQVNEWIQIIPCSVKAVKSIDGVEIWKKG
jgi:small nuclear ribonucleoprotein (snRNP)-like protein